MTKPKYRIHDKVCLKRGASFEEQISKWGGYASITKIIPGIQDNLDSIWYDVRASSGYVNAYPQCDLIPFFADNTTITNKQARAMLEAE